MTTPALLVTAPAAWWYFGPQTGKASGFSSLTVAWDPGGVRRWTVDLEISEFFLLILVGLGADGSGERPSVGGEVFCSPACLWHVPPNWPRPLRFMLLLSLFKTESHRVALAGLELTEILLPLPQEFWS